MTLKIDKNCVGCDMCLPVCPNDAIHEQKSMYIINQDKCTECIGFYNKPQCIEVCPINCIAIDPNYIETKEQILNKLDRNKL